MKLTRLQRVLQLITLLQSSQYYAPNELAKKLGVSRRTIFRDLDLLRKVGIPYYHDDENGGYRIHSNYLLPPLNLNQLEAISLMLTSQHIQGGCLEPLQRPAQQAAAKVQRSLPSYIQHHCSQVLKDTSMRCACHVQGLNQEKYFALLQKAIRQKQNVKIQYQSFYEKEKIQTILSPYHLHFDRRAWYVMGFSSIHESVRTFKLSRFLDALPLEQKYYLEKPFRIEDYLGQAWNMIPEGQIYHIKLRFEPTVAGNVAEVLWHPTQQLTRHANGQLTFEADVDGIREINWWIMGYGSQVEVLEPKILRERIMEMINAMAEKYHSDNRDKKK